jgi:hypothetical protein
MGGFLALGCGAPDAHQNRNPAQMKKLCGVATGGWWFRSMRSCVRLTATGKTQRMRPQRPLSSKPSNAWKRGFKTPDPIASVRNGWRVAEGRKRDGVQSFFRTGYSENGASKAEGFGVTSGLVEGRKFSAKQTPEGCPSTRKIAHRQTPGCSSKSRIPPFTVRTEIGPPPP